MGIAPQFYKTIPPEQRILGLHLESLALNSDKCTLIGHKLYKTAAPAISKRLKNTLKSPINMELERVRTHDYQGTQTQSSILWETPVYMREKCYFGKKKERISAVLLAYFDVMNDRVIGVGDQIQWWSHADSFLGISWLLPVLSEIRAY